MPHFFNLNLISVCFRFKPFAACPPPLLHEGEVESLKAAGGRMGGDGRLIVTVR